MNFLQKISNIFQRIRYTPGSDNERSHKNGSNNEEVDEEENIEMMSTSITRSIYQENDDEEDVFTSATDFNNSSDIETETWTRSRSQSRFSSGTYHSSPYADTEECTETCLIETGDFESEKTGEKADSSNRESCDETYESRTDRSADSNYTLELNCYTDTEEITPANILAYPFQLAGDGYPKKSILKKYMNKSTATGKKSAKSRSRSIVQFFGAKPSKSDSVTSEAIREALYSLSMRSPSTKSDLQDDSEIKPNVRVPSVASIDLIKHQAAEYGAAPRLSMKSSIFIRSDDDEDQKMKTFQTFADPKRHRAKTVKKKIRESSEEEVVERDESKTESLDESGEEEESEESTEAKESSVVSQSNELNETENIKNDNDVSEGTDVSEVSESSGMTEDFKLHEDVDSGAGRKSTPKKPLYLRRITNAAITQVRKWFGRKKATHDLPTETAMETMEETSPEPEDIKLESEIKIEPDSISGHKKDKNRFWKGFKLKRVKSDKTKKKSKKTKKSEHRRFVPSLEDDDLSDEYRISDLAGLGYDDIIAVRQLMGGPSDRSSRASLASISSWGSVGDMSAMFGSVAGSTMSVTDGVKKGSRLSILAELKIEYSKRECCREYTYTAPVNLHAIEMQYRDMKRGDLVRLHQNKLTFYNFEMFVAKSTARKVWSELWEILKKIFKYGTSEDIFTLNNYEFYALLIFHDIYLGNLIRDFRLIEEFGPLIGIYVKLFTIIFIDTPIMMFVLTMAGMTRFTYLKFYNSMQVLRGFGYGMFVLFLLHEVVSWANFDLGVRCVIKLVHDRDMWQKCPTESSSSDWTEKCISFPTNQSHNTFCPVEHKRWNGTENFASQNFMRFMMTNLYDDIGQTNWQINVLHILMASIWLLIFGMVAMGIRRSKFILMTIQLIAMSILFVTCISVIPYRLSYDIGTAYYPFWKLIDMEVLQHIMRVCFPFLRLPFLIWIATMRPDKADPETTTVIVLFIKIFLYLVLYLSTHVAVLRVITNYKINTKCLIIEDLIYVYALIPDFFSESTFGPLLTTTWMCMWNGFSMIRAILILHMAQETISDIFPSFRKYPFFLLATLCLTCNAIIRLHYYKTTSDFMTNTFILQVDACVIITTAIFILGLKFIYTWIRFRDDFYFMYKRFPSEFWEIWLNIASYLSLVSLGFVIAKEGIINKMENLTAWAIILIILTLAFAMLLKHLCYFIYTGRTAEAIRPKNDWLPYDPKLQRARRYYFSARDIRTRRPRTLYICTDHQCLNQSMYFIQIAGKQTAFVGEIRRTRAVWKEADESERKRSGVSFFITW